MKFKFRVWVVELILWGVLAGFCWGQCPGGVCYRTEVGQTVSEDKLALEPVEFMRKTVGSVSDASAKKYETFDSYIASRRADAIAGKGFEALFSLDFNAESDSENVLVTTAALGRPSDPADLALVNRESRKIVRLYQCKLGVVAAVKAATDPKYSAFTILVPKDVFEKLAGDSDSETKELIDSGKIAFSVDGYSADTRENYEYRSVDFLHDEYDNKCSAVKKAGFGNEK